MHNITQLYNIYRESTGVTIDSRKVQPGNIFFALKGENSNGNIFAAGALEQGAVCCVIDDEAYKTDDRYFLVEDTLQALQQLAASHRDNLLIPFIAITGSNGKTTTKELMHAVLHKKYRTFATRGNLNNHIGVPLSVLSVRSDDEMAIIEMGANHQKEISFLCSIAKPTHGLITNIGKAHLEGFGGEEGVLKGKSELYQYLIQTGGIVFVNSGQHKLKNVYAGYDRMVRYGTREDDAVHGKIFTTDKFATVEINDTLIRSQLVGTYNAENMIAAACIGKYFNVEMDDISSAIENYQPQNNRSEWKEIAGNHFILDAYNANPSSMKAAIENFAKLPVSPKILILGDMLEMGEYAAAEHENILQLVLQQNFDSVITVGEAFMKAAEGKNVRAFKNNMEAKEYFAAQNFKNVYFLLKGSRGIALEKIVE